MYARIMIITVTLVSLLYADGFVALNTGVAWPQTLSTISGDRAAWHWGCEWGGMTDSKVGFGGVFDMLMKRTHETTKVGADTTVASGMFETYTLGSGIRRTQLSVGFGMWINPMDEFPVRPIIRGSFMPSMMILVNDYDTGADEDIIPPTGAYWGYVATAGADVHYMVSESFSVFGGVGFRFGSVKKRINYDRFAFSDDEPEEYEYLRQPMEGVSIRFGFMFW